MADSTEKPEDQGGKVPADGATPPVTTDNTEHLLDTHFDRLEKLLKGEEDPPPKPLDQKAIAEQLADIKRVVTETVTPPPAAPTKESPPKEHWWFRK